MTGDEFLYGKRHAPPVLKKLDDIANEVNTKFRMRGIARGMVCIQEDINSEDLEIQKRVYDATKEPDAHKRLNILIEIQKQMKYMWIGIRYLLKQHALTVGEIGVLSTYANEIDDQIEAWKKSIEKKLKL